MSTPNGIQWHCLPFEQLTASQLYHILTLREEVFVVEQNCPYQDADGKDPKCYHVWAEAPSTTLRMTPDNSTTLRMTPILAYARIVKPGVSYPEVAIGRVVTAPEVRRTGLGKELVRVTLDCVKDLYGETTIRLSAQAYLLGFYCGFGFEVITEPYMEDGILHVGMVRKPTVDSQ